MFPSFGGGGGDPMIAEMNRMMSAMHQSMSSMLGAGFQTLHDTTPLGHQTQFGEYRSRSRPPLIEELPAEAERQRSHSRPHASGSEPIIQEPDEDEDMAAAAHSSHPRTHSHAHRAAQRTSAGQPSHQQQRQYAQQQQQQYAQQQQQQQSSFMAPFVGLSDMFGGFGATGNGAAVYSYSSSSSYSSSGGTGGASYSTRTTMRAGPGGVQEVQRTVRDGRTGEQQMTIERRLGDKERITTRTRDSTGQDSTNDVLRGVDDPNQFDDTWRQHAAQALPTWGLGDQRMLGRGQQQQQQAWQALEPAQGQGAQYQQQQQQQQQYGARGMQQQSQGARWA